MALTGSTIPGYGTYGYQQLNAEKAYQQALAGISGRRRSLLSTYGYQADFDEHGLARNVHIDPNSQYGGVQQMLRGDAQASDQAEEGAIGRGLGSGEGLGAQGASDAQYQHGLHSKQLADSLMGGLSDLTQEQTGAEQTHSDSLWQIEHDAAQEALANQDFTPAAPGDPIDETADDTVYNTPNAPITAKTSNVTPQMKARIAQLIKQTRGKPVPKVAKRVLPKPKKKGRR
jgi:hypothetical protein